jgi:S1-C subfamily serine protease
MRARRLATPLLLIAAVSITWLALGGRGTASTAGATASAATLQSQFIAVVNRVTPSVVQIESPAGLGSGEIFDSRGHIVTNAHVVGSQTSFTVTLASGERHRGRLIGKFLPDDLAVIKIDATGLRPIAFSSARIKVGTIVLAVGNPLGLRSSVTEGIVSAVGRTVSDPTGGAIIQAIQTSAPINPGNSGGALVNLSGQLVGIPTLGVSDPRLGGAAAGIGFAIPADRVRDLAGQMIAHGRVVNSHRPYLGVSIGETQGAGVYVASVVAGGPAARAGIRAGDVVTSIGGESTPTTSDFSEAIARFVPGQQVRISVRRSDGTNPTVVATLGEFPGS